MEKQVVFHIVKKQRSSGEPITCVESIRNSGQQTSYAFPRNLQPDKIHEELFKLPTVKNAVKALVKVGQYRNLTVTLRDALLEKYMDEDFNFVFEEHYLEEIGSPSNAPKAEADDLLTTRIRDILNALKDQNDTTEVTLTGVEKKLFIEKFNGRQKARDWLIKFESECERNNIRTDARRVRCLKLFLTESAEEWYKSNAMKLSEDDWTAWSLSFMRVFSDKGWSKVRYAHSFKYMAGSLVDYALKKERLILEVESKMTTESRINHIVMGLPLRIQEKLDREEIEETDQLINKLGQYEFENKKQDTLSGEKRQAKLKLVSERSMPEKKPCSICESLGFPERYHPIEKCRNRDRYQQKLKFNLTETDIQSTSTFEADEKN